jgi:hypothetical protein
MKRRIQKAIIAQIKVTEGCKECGYNDHHAALDFNHRDPATKDFSPGQGIYSTAKLQAEIDKCDILCSNCHRVHTYNSHPSRMGKAGTSGCSNTH